MRAQLWIYTRLLEARSHLATRDDCGALSWPLCGCMHETLLRADCIFLAWARRLLAAKSG